MPTHPIQASALFAQIRRGHGDTQIPTLVIDTDALYLAFPQARPKGPQPPPPPDPVYDVDEDHMMGVSTQGYCPLRMADYLYLSPKGWEHYRSQFKAEYLVATRDFTWTEDLTQEQGWEIESGKIDTFYKDLIKGLPKGIKAVQKKMDKLQWQLDYLKALQGG